MNRNDTLKLRSFMARAINDLSVRHGDMPDKTKADQRAKAAAGKEIDEATRLYHKLDPGPYKAPKIPKEIVVGQCPCGKDVKIGEKYSTSVEGTTTVTRTCSCGRKNDVDLTVRRRLQSQNWEVRECFCGGKVRLRSDFAGVGFRGYEGPRDFAGTTRKNRTATTECSDCHCKWTIQIRFATLKDGESKGTLQRTTNQTVRRCRSCAKLDIPGLTTVEPKRAKSS